MLMMTMANAGKLRPGVEARIPERAARARPRDEIAPHR
jgi:hypothetical protein